jgi:hypothetical protein
MHSAAATATSPAIRKTGLRQQPLDSRLLAAR